MVPRPASHATTICVSIPVCLQVVLYCWNVTHGCQPLCWIVLDIVKPPPFCRWSLGLVYETFKKNSCRNISKCTSFLAMANFDTNKVRPKNVFQIPHNRAECCHPCKYWQSNLNARLLFAEWALKNNVKLLICITKTIFNEATFHGKTPITGGMYGMTCWV